MDLEVIKRYIILGILGMALILIFILPICIFSDIEKQRDFELEKYKIEMQYKHGDVVEENK